MAAPNAHPLCWIGDRPGSGKLHVLATNGRGLCETVYAANYYHVNARHVHSTITPFALHGQPTCAACARILRTQDAIRSLRRP